jgi:formate dehydrogenase beta subunit
VIQAIAEGRRAASGIDKYLGGDGDIDISLLDETPLDIELSGVENFFDLPRTTAPRIAHNEAVACMALVESGYSAEAAIKEAERCLRCDLRLALRPVALPPEPWLEFNSDNAERLPETEGVYQLLDENKVVYAIKGVTNLREAISELVNTSTKAKFFLFKEDPMYSKAESELIQEYLKEHGCMPLGEGADDLDDLF